MLGTHSVQIESGFLEFNDQYTLYAWHEWFVEHMKNTWLALTQINYLMNVSCSLKKFRSISVEKRKKKRDLIY